MQDQELDNLKFFARQCKSRVRIAYFIGAEIDGQFTRTQLRGLAWLPVVRLGTPLTAQMSLDACDEFLDTEWLHYIVVCAHAKTPYLIGIALLRTEEENGDIQIFTQLLANCEAITTGQHDIEND